MNYYPFHIGDYLSATRHLSWEEDLAYRRLLDTYYVHEKPLPLDHRQVCRLVLATTEEQREAVRIVLEEFFEKTDEGWINRRADAEIAEMQARQQKQRDKANKRWQKPEPELGNASGMPQQPIWNAAAQNGDAAAMPPTPTPTPTPTPVLREEPNGSSVGGQPPKVPDCPHREILKLFAEKLPTLPQPRVEIWNEGKGADALRQRWKWLLTASRGDGTRYATNADEGLDWFSRFFGFVSESDFLMGRSKAEFKCTLQWLVTKDNFFKVVQGNYNGGER